MNTVTPKMRIAVPSPARKGAEIEIKTLISHPMESGFRRDQRGEQIPRNILTRFECHFYPSGNVPSGNPDPNPERLVFACDLHPGMAANPFISFFARATVSGQFLFRWIDQHGALFTARRDLQVSDAG